MINIKEINDWLDSAQLICTKTDGKTKYNFNKFMFPLKFTSKIYRHDLTLQEARDNQQELEILINKLNNNYNATNKTKITEKDDTLRFAKILFSTRKDVINAFKKGIFLYVDGSQEEKETDEETDEESTLENEKIDSTGIPELESEKSAEQRKNKQGKGLKILTPNQMLTRLPITLAKLKAENNSEKLKNEIRQLLCAQIKIAFKTNL